MQTTTDAFVENQEQQSCVYKFSFHEQFITPYVFQIRTVVKVW